MVKIEGENGIYFNVVLNKIQRSLNIKTKKETITRVVDALCREGAFNALYKTIESVLKQEGKIKHECVFTTEGYCIFCHNVRPDSKADREARLVDF